MRAVNFHRSAFPCLALIMMLGPLRAYAGISPEQLQFFEQRIRPVLAKECYECHSTGANDIKGGLTLDTRKGILEGGSSGEPTLVPGEPARSRLLIALEHKDEDLSMPPNKQLPRDVINDFRRWISMGAPDPRDGDPQELERLAASARARAHWAFQPPVMPATPAVEPSHWPNNPIDRFILARLNQKGLQPVPDASPAALIRRIYFDLIGLPPPPDAVKEFVRRPSQEAVERMVDRLLASPRFGERWSRHWLDVARYAESSGKEFNFTYPHAWPYRDYVIRAFNNDMPYNQFVREQLAGDLLPARNQQEKEQQQLATGFLAIGPKRHNAGRAVFQMDLVDDQIQATSKAFLGLTTGCARCHDHKFDPIPTEDYYAMAGIFLSTDTLYGTVKKQYSRHPTDLIPYGPNAEALDKSYQAHLSRQQKTREELDKAEKALQSLKDKEKKKRNEQQLAEAKAKVKKLKEQLKQQEENAPIPPLYAMGVRESDKTVAAQISIGGDPGNRGNRVDRGFLSAVQVSDPPPIPEDGSGRLALAEWITRPENPLTARVMVNRVWDHLMGRGLVPTVNNFGALGDPPSHPDLLDYLAIQFMEDEWSVKRLIRSIALSHTYQLSTRPNPANQAIDPANTWFWRMNPRRLEVEPLRDAMLTISGDLELSPPKGSTVTELGQQLARTFDYEEINPDSRHRSVYLPIVRHYEPRMFQEFDFAASSLVVGKRSVTTGPQQALFFLNSDFVLEQARKTAGRLNQEITGDVHAKIRTAYEWILNRPPSPAELAAVEDFLKKAETSLRENAKNARERNKQIWTSFLQTLFSSAEFRYLVEPPGPRNQSHMLTSKRKLR